MLNAFQQQKTIRQNNYHQTNTNIYFINLPTIYSIINQIESKFDRIVVAFVSYRKKFPRSISKLFYTHYVIRIVWLDRVVLILHTYTHFEIEQQKKNEYYENNGKSHNSRKRIIIIITMKQQ